MPHAAQALKVLHVLHATLPHEHHHQGWTACCSATLMHNKSGMLAAGATGASAGKKEKKEKRNSLPVVLQGVLHLAISIVQLTAALHRVCRRWDAFPAAARHLLTSMHDDSKWSDSVVTPFNVQIWVLPSV
jgi:hypothetical protein